MRAEIAATPAVLTAGTTYTAGDLDLRYLEAMYRSARFPGAATDLAALRAVVDQPGHRATEEQTRVLVDGVVPQRDLTCRGVPLPDPTF
ncbi:hypothetical protein ABZ816_37070 [Actinosynnema sp. NPDC047251]|uniref:hypothetical protein n=1 Tax=Saccharothrix espanaensis TaxID=103731 RepID=UPI000687781E|nr:hypothetical protein [Saccharothrix espanaensis]